MATNPPAVEDFLSNAELGNDLRPPITPARQRLWEGVSVYDTLEAAAKRAARLRPPRRFVAVLNVPEGGSIAWAKTLRDPAHHTVWGAAQDILERVEHVMELPTARD